MLTSPGFGSLLCIVSELRLFCAHELCVSCPRVFPEEDKVKSGVAHILRIPSSRTARESGAAFTWKSDARDQHGKDRAIPLSVTTRCDEMKIAVSIVPAQRMASRNQHGAAL